MNGLKDVYDALEEIAKVTGQKKKLSLAQCALNNVSLSSQLPWFKEVVFAAYNDEKYHTTQVNYGFQEMHQSPLPRLFANLARLAQKGSCSKQENELLARQSSINLETVEVVNRILKKDLRCGLGKASWEKLVPELKPKFFKPMLAEKDLDKFIEYAGTSDNVFWSVKLDGVRCITHVNSLDDIRFYSRTGKEYFNFGHIAEKLRSILESKKIDFPLILDGEIVHKDGFQTLMKFVRKKNCPSLDKTVQYFIFDYDDVKLAFHKKYFVLASTFRGGSNAIVQSLWQHSIKPSEFNKFSLCDIAKNIIYDGHEGIILRTKDGLYENKRSRQMCKVKALYLEDKKIEVDLYVIDYTLGTGKYADILGALICIYKNKQVSVGSGFTDAQRDEFALRIPKMIEVHADSITEDGSLRFPIFSKVKEW